MCQRIGRVFICTSLSDWFHRPLLAASPEPIVGGSRFAWVWMIDHSATWLRADREDPANASIDSRAAGLPTPDFVTDGHDFVVSAEQVFDFDAIFRERCEELSRLAHDGVAASIHLRLRKLGILAVLDLGVVEIDEGINATPVEVLHEPARDLNVLLRNTPSSHPSPEHSHASRARLLWHLPRRRLQSIRPGVTRHRRAPATAGAKRAGSSNGRLLDACDSLGPQIGRFLTSPFA